MMKIIYITNGGVNQGEGLALLNILNGLDLNYVSPFVVCPRYSAFTKELESLNIRFKVFNFYNCVYPQLRSTKDFFLWIPRYLRIILINYIAFYKFRKLVKAEKPDIIHTNTGVIRFGSKVAKKFSIPHVWHVREYQNLDFGWTPIGGGKKQIELYAQPNNHCISITKDIFNYFKLNVDKDRVVYDGVFPKKDITGFNNIILDSNKKYFLFVGCLKESKGVLDVIEAFDVASNNLPDNIELWLAGSDEIGIKDIISGTSCSNRIRYLGFRKDVYNLMSNSIALIVPSRFEGFGFITAEAMYNRCLVIGRNTGGTKEQFDNGLRDTGSEIGLRFNSNEELSNKIRLVVTKSPNFEMIKDSAFKVVNSKYTIENNAIEIKSFYSNL